jgi:hypothetical protein
MLRLFLTSASFFSLCTLKGTWDSNSCYWSKRVRQDLVVTFLNLAYFDRLTKFQIRDVHLDIVWKVGWKSFDFQLTQLSHQLTTYHYTWRVTNKFNWNVDFNFFALVKLEEVNVQQHFVYWVELYVLKDRSVVRAFDIQVYFVYFWRINQVSEQDSWGVEVNLLSAAIQYTWYIRLIAQLFRLCFTEICSFKPYNL